MAATKVTGLEKALSGFHKIVMATEANDTLTLNEKQKAIDTLYTNTLPAIEQYTKLLQQLEAQANGNR
jgi:hypothetical protein